MSPVLTIRGLTKRFGRVVANDRVDLDVAAGEVLGLLGHNGAGKTTLVNQVIGLARPDAGSVTLDGVDAVAHPHRARQRAAVQAQANVPITGMTPRVAINLVGRMRGGRPARIADRTDELLDALDLAAWADTPAQKISGGIARLTAFCMAAVHPTSLVVLDEPTNDVDPVRRRLLWTQIRALADTGTAVLLVTHNVREAERAVDRLAILDNGVKLADDTPAGLTADLRGWLTIELDLTSGASIDWPPVAHRPDRARSRATAAVPAESAAEVVAWAQQRVADGLVERYALTPASLEDVYIGLVGSAEATTMQREAK
ncbi:ABC-2 type transport system ATP-binding protein [Stackebrandtia endophytica]|uniref:ABC-2 type transport system ATP-binding protein n=1 Tax=Stackebrandtia endophytica TaxID=1496996 RepID=A0A543B075_9ACTN|nr:ABC transporter ATP-binding protein [Stackebrandtia endophytica]TQL78196.1 ABC-2 type transport system ATP-binding protein [Stackebrandtia endophytica]